ncbi:MAG: Holliday junction branch migration DNA helicase RuvB [Eubacteriales bacterium]|nr:Holliday junction branch migration DNA helicase RuvB [Eubacteriales bacterium]
MNKKNLRLEASIEEKKEEKTLRPLSFNEYIGQDKIKENLKIYIEAAKNRKEPLDHTLFYGPPGLGKTTLANIIANELGVKIKITSGPTIEKPGDIASLLNDLDEKDVLFIDEIHRINRQVEEVLYPAMEDYAIDILVGTEGAKRSIRLELPHFTLVGATTRAGLLSSPLRDRFGIISKVEFYSKEELETIVKRSSKLLNIQIDDDGAKAIALRSRGTPRLANRLLKRVRDFAEVKYDGRITREVSDIAMDTLDVDKLGLDQNDRNYLLTIIQKFAGGPVGIDTLSTAISEDSGTLEELYEPYLIMKGLIQRTIRGRIATSLAYEHLGITYQTKLDFT